MPRDPTGVTAAERTALAALASLVDWDRVRVQRGGGRLRAAVLRLSGGRAVTLGNRIFLPDRAADDLAVLAHELVHCGQYQRWGAVRYYLRGAAAQLRDLVHHATGLGRSSYAYVIEPGKPLSAYGMEQQGQIVEDLVRVTPPPPAAPTAPARFHPDRPPLP